MLLVMVAKAVVVVVIMEVVVSMELGVAVLGIKVFSSSLGIVDGACCVSKFLLRTSKASVVAAVETGGVVVG